MLPQLDVLRDPDVPPGTQPGAPGQPGAVPGVAGQPGQPGAPPGVGPMGPSLFPAFEEISIQCAGYISRDDEDNSLRIIGSEDGMPDDLTDEPDMFSTGGIVYLNRGTNDGISPGSQYYTHRRLPNRWGDKSPVILRTGWVTILAAQERRSIAEVIQACASLEVDDYLLPFEPIPVPLIVRQEAANMLTPETGQTRGRIMASMEDITLFGAGNVLGIDVGERDGVIPGNIFVVYRYIYDDAPRKVLGELVVLFTQEETSTVKVLTSIDYMKIGDDIELK